MTSSHNKVWEKLPPARAGQVIGLFGGSFNPPHPGHYQTARTAFIKAKLDQVWWLITPGNPLKDNDGLPDVVDRVRAVEAGLHDRRMRVTAFEMTLGQVFTARVLEEIAKRRKGVRFVWIIGADNLQQMHQWKDWRKIFRLVSVIVVARPGYRSAALNSLTAHNFRKSRKNPAHLGSAKLPAWSFIHGPRVALSSTMLRSNAR